MQIKLQRLLNYKNNKVISQYRNEYPDSTMSADEAFAELMKYIWLCRKHVLEKKQFPTNDTLKFNCVIHVEMEEIDNMWHTFLLFTRDYQSFCNDYLNGIFFHHDPLPVKQGKVSKKTYENELNNYLSYIYENLGEATLVKWFKEYA
ncbi:MAG: hypothetical protein A3F13_07160 [Gammaproteobacteria bacterium RIFCSPHIGHO2_12_FULL_40_19]|nr:MAG: hypothetical protein A3F13_07160 [Gammaproteobacteria bacterium RIFCSPHIGHO2_12_FULL_40_19]